MRGDRWLGLGTYKAGVKGRGAPACDCGRVGLVVVIEVPAWVELAAGLDQVDEAVGGCSREQLDEGAEGGEACQGGMHGCGG